MRGEGSVSPRWTLRSLSALQSIAAASSPAKLAAAVAAGAEGTIAYEDEDLKVRARELSGGGVDVVIDPVGGEKSEAALRALRILREALRDRFHCGYRVRAAESGVAQQQERHRDRLGGMGGKRSSRQSATDRGIGDRW